MAETAFQIQYRQEMIKGFEQRNSLLRDSVTTEAVIKGQQATFLIVDSGDKTAVTRGANGNIPYYANNNTQVNVQRNQAGPLKFPVQFYSAFKRDYNAVAYYSIVTTGITNPAVLGVDFNVVDKNGVVLQPLEGKFSFTFLNAERAMDTIYIKTLNNPATGIRKMEVQIVENKTNQFYVDIFSTAFRRPVEIR